MKNVDFTDEEKAMLWAYAKENYIDKDVASFDDMVTGVANDLGLQREWVVRAFHENRKIRSCTKALFKARAARRRAEEDAIAYLHDIDKPAWKRWMKSAGRLLSNPFRRGF